jgi:glycosyltransferase involved in cell wall biosynthesis
MLCPVRITVVIPTFRRPEPLRRGLAALTAQVRPPDAVLVVVRPEDYGAREVVRSVEHSLPVRTVDVLRPGLVAALNAGLDAADGDVVAFTDDDAEPHADWLHRIEEVLASDERIAGVGGRDWVYYDDRLVDGQAKIVGNVSWYGRVTGNHHWGTGEPRDVYVLKGANMAFRRQPLSEVRFDERLVGVGTEHHSELGACLKLRSHGWRIVYDPSIGVDHRPAPRLEGRRQLDQERVIRCAAHNETLALLEYLPAWRRAGHLVWALSTGNVATPGPLQLVRSVLIRRRLNWGGTRAAVRGRIDGWRAYRASRRRPSPSVLAIGHSTYGASRASQLLDVGPTTAVVCAGPGLRGMVRACRAVLGRPARIVYLGDIGASTAVSALLARMLRRRVVVDTGDLSYELARSVGGRSRLGLVAVALGERAALSCAHHVVVRGYAHLDHLDGKPVSVVPDVAPEEARPVAGDAVRALLGLPDDAFVIGLVGSLKWAPRLQRCYGWDLIEALRNTGPEVHALIVGEGDGRVWLQRRTVELGVEDRCHFAGRVPAERIAEWIGAMDAAISTQTNDAVGAVRTTGKLPLYLACGCPVLASHVGEAARLLGPLGWTIQYAGTIDAGYPTRLGRAIQNWAADRNRQDERRRAALRLASEAFDPAQMRARLAAVLDAVGKR